MSNVRANPNPLKELEEKEKEHKENRGAEPCHPFYSPAFADIFQYPTLSPCADPSLALPESPKSKP